jgi:hypothetical protein
MRFTTHLEILVTRHSQPIHLAPSLRCEKKRIKIKRAKNMQSRVTFGSATHIGVVRRANEDQYMIARLSKVFEILQASLASDG